MFQVSLDSLAVVLKMSPEPTASVSPEIFLLTQISGSTLDLRNQKLWGVVQQSVF